MKISGKLPRWAVLLILVIVGLLLVWLPGFYKWQWDDGVIRGIGEAVLIGAVLAFTIDRWFREDFAKDVFYAAVGDLLRPEFRDELRWITSFKWLAVKTLVHLNIEDLGNDVVRITLTIRREVENISSAPEKVRAYMGIDEWGIAGQKSHIAKCAIQKKDFQAEATVFENKPHHLSAATEEVLVDPEESVKTFSKTVEYKHANDIYVLALLTPSKDPEVEVEISDTLEREVSFTHRGKMETEPFFTKRTLKGTYLPGQMMIARWWPKIQKVI